MAIAFQVLGGPLDDNAVLATVDTGQHLTRLLFDCGEGTLAGLAFNETLDIDHVLFSHYHMDHISGFDSFFRRHFDRTARANHLWGPPGTCELMGHRFRGFSWNLVEDKAVAWHCHDIFPDHIATVRYELGESFATAHAESSMPRRNHQILSTPGCRVEALTLNHGIPSIGYIVREHERINVDPERLARIGLTPGPWLKQLREEDDAAPESMIIDGSRFATAELRENLLVRSRGESLAYLTDFFADESEIQRLAARLHGIDTLVCECQYRHRDAELAAKNHHMTTTKVATLAAAAEVRRLCLIHLSDRYTAAEWPEMRAEAAAIFPAVEFPDGW